ncbi:unannotated protein [freshwater metagenome]|uniref:Unannotated protein n=1 Tax=freshwater metagenome TaxID=449393 RepID=A0A6J6Z6Z2_9ZZZZ
MINGVNTENNALPAIIFEHMSLASNILSVLLALVCVASAYTDLTMMPQIVESMTKLKMPIRIIPALGFAKLAGAAGLMIGFANDNLRIYAAFCLAVYFVLATWCHVRVRDTTTNTIPALVLCLVSIATLLTSI